MDPANGTATSPMAAEPIAIDLEPIGLAPDKGAGEDKGLLETVRGKRNRILLGAPRFGDLLAELLASSPQLPVELEAEVKKGYDFQRVRPTLTLLPDSGCAFVAVELGIELLATLGGGTDEVDRPIAWDVQPREVVRQLTYRETSTTGYEVGGEAGAGPAKALAKLTNQHSYEQEGVRYVRERYGYGLNFSEVGWRLQASADHELAGDIDGLEFVAKLPKGAALSGRFHIAAEIAVEAGLDRWLTRSFGPRRGAPILEAVYRLSA